MGTKLENFSDTYKLLRVKSKMNCDILCRVS